MFRKSQASYSDFLIGFLVLILITFIFTRTIIDLNSKDDKIQELINDGNEISNSFMNQGYKEDEWTNPNGRIGFVNDGKIIKNNFDKLRDLNYDKTKILLGAKSDYVVYFEYDNKKLSYGNKEVYGKFDNTNKIKSENIIKITRLVYSPLHENKIVKMNILIF
jgi:hypothetical protein